MTHLRSVSTGLICFLLMITTFSLSDALALPAPKASAGSCPAPLALGHASARDIAATPLYHETANPKSGSVAKRTNNEATPMEITKSQDVGFFRLQLLQGHTNDVDLQRSGLQISATAVKIHQVSTYWSQYTDTSGSAQLQETLTALSSMLQPNILYPQHAPMLPYPKGPWKQFTLPASPGRNERDLTFILNAVDGMIVRCRGAYRLPPPEADSTNVARRRALRLEAAAIAAYWNYFTRVKATEWARWNLRGERLFEQRQKLRFVIDAFIMDPTTVGIIKNIDKAQKAQDGDSGSIGGWPPQRRDCQVFAAGTPKFRQHLGSPAGKWVSELLLSYENQEATKLGRKLITSVAVWMPQPGCDLPALKWEIKDYNPELSRMIDNAVMSEGLPEHGTGPTPQFDSSSGKVPPPGYDPQVNHFQDNGRAQ